MELETLRDWVIIIYGVLGILFLLALTLAMLGLWYATRVLTQSIRDLIRDPIRPTLENVRYTSEHIRGTTEFVADSAVSPLIRVIAAGRGVRRGIGAFTRLRRRG